MHGNDLTDLTIAEVAPLISGGRVSPVELTHAYLARIEWLNPSLNAYVSVIAETALIEARTLEDELAHGECRGPLHGIPIGLKDVVATRGVRTAAGARILADNVPGEDATVTARLRAAGAVLLGKTNTHEFAYGVTTNNPHFGSTRNPWNPEFIPGGSSGGSGAAVAAGMAAMAIGTDTGGSIRIPASLCGIVGLKPTHGRVSTAGVIPLSWSLDTVGPLTRSVEDAAIVLGCIAGVDARDPVTPPVPIVDYRGHTGMGVAGLRLGIPRSGFFDGLDPDVSSAIEAAIAVFRALGAHIEDVDASVLRRNRTAMRDIQQAEARRYHARWLQERAGDYGDDVRENLARRADMTADELVQAFRVRDAMIQFVSTLLHDHDALILPTTRIPAVPLGMEVVTIEGQQETLRDVLTPNTNSFNLVGVPALSLPCGFTASGLPIGVQVVGRRWNEAMILRIGAAYERATRWHTHRPALHHA